MFEVIDFSVHLLLKIEILKSHDINISKEIIEDIVRFPDKIEMGYKGRQIATKKVLMKRMFLELSTKQNLKRF